MRCCRSDWPGLCLFCCYQPLCVVSQQRWFGLFFCFINFPIISTFTPIFFIEISFVLLPPPPLEWWDAVLQKRLAWALFVVFLLTESILGFFVSLVSLCQPTELIWVFFCFVIFPILLPPPPSSWLKSFIKIISPNTLLLIMLAKVEGVFFISQNVSGLIAVYVWLEIQPCFISSLNGII